MSNARNIAGITTDAVNASSELVPVYACRAWVNFNGTGTPAIRDSGNVSSITDNGTGDYTVTFSSAMPDANYSVTGSLLYARTIFGIQTISTGSIRVSGYDEGVGYYDSSIFCVAVFR